MQKIILVLFVLIGLGLKVNAQMINPTSNFLPSDKSKIVQHTLREEK